MGVVGWMFFCWVWFGDDDVWVLLGVYVDVMVVDFVDLDVGEE